MTITLAHADVASF